MIKQIAAVSTLVLTLTGCVSPTPDTYVAQAVTKITTKQETDLIDQAIVDKKIDSIDSMISKLNNTVGKTWYVFSGATPSGWDCSGLVMWAYEQLGITLEHRATKQANAGFATTEPIPGDIVVFKYNGSQSAYHVGIYIGNGNMIHAPRKGEVTRVESVSKFGGKYSKVSYRRMLQGI